MNFTWLGLLADNLRESPASRTNLPWVKLIVSWPWIAILLTTGVVTAIPAVVLTWSRETVCVVVSTFVACANKTTPLFPTGAV